MLQKKGHRAEGSYNLSYTSTREMFLKLIDPIADNKNLGLHSLRAAGASAAAGSDVSDRMISKYGRWKSEKGRNGYIKDSVKNR